MSTSNLFLIQSAYHATTAVIEKLRQLYSANDAIVLMGDAVLLANDDFFKSLAVIYVLDNESANLPDAQQTNIKVISYAEFADLTLSFARSISLK
jgi:sulfur transfer complex TusBCD TusB component (DsrH family)